MRVIFMPDKIIRSGSAPVYDEKDQVIANIHYKYFSMSNHLEITDHNGKIMSMGRKKIFSFMPTWYITDELDVEVGMIKQRWAFFSRRYFYVNNKGEEFSIEGSMMARRFSIYKDGHQVIQVSSQAGFFSMRPHSFQVSIFDDQMSTFEAINIVEGIRSLVELSDSNN